MLLVGRLVKLLVLGHAVGSVDHTMKRHGSAWELSNVEKALEFAEGETTVGRLRLGRVGDGEIGLRHWALSPQYTNRA